MHFQQAHEWFWSACQNEPYPLLCHWLWVGMEVVEALLRSLWSHLSCCYSRISCSSKLLEFHHQKKKATGWGRNGAQEKLPAIMASRCFDRASEFSSMALFSFLKWIPAASFTISVTQPSARRSRCLNSSPLRGWPSFEKVLLLVGLMGACMLCRSKDWVCLANNDSNPPSQEPDPDRVRDTPGSRKVSTKLAEKC